VKLRAVRLRHVRRFDGRGTALEGIDDGVNVLAAPNEFGKSTLVDALRTALFVKATSRRGEVWSLVPDPGAGAPEIEIDLDHDGTGFRLYKRFWSGPRARVSERARDRTIATGDAVQDWLEDVLGADRREGGPLGLLWVTQGRSLEPPAAGDDTLDALLEREVGDVVGGERARAVLERARADRDRLVTATGKPKAHGAYDVALTRRRDLDAAVVDLEAKAATSERTRARLGEIDARLGELEDREEAQRLADALAAAERALDAARVAVEALSARTRELEAARADESRAAAALDALRDQQARARALRARSGRAEAGRSDALTRRVRAEEAEAAARAERDRHRGALEAARRERERAQKAASAAAAAKEIVAVEARLARARTAEDQRARAAAERADIRLGAEAVAELERLRDARAEARTRRDAARPTLRIHYAADAGGRVRVGERVLADGESHILGGRTVLTLDGIGELVVEPGGSKDAAATDLAVEEAERALAEALAAHGVADVATARARQRAAESLDARIAELARERDRLAPTGPDALAHELEVKRRQLAEHDDDAPPLADAEAAEQTAYDALAEAEATWRARLGDAHTAREAAARAVSEAALLDERRREFLAELGPEESWQDALGGAEARLDTARTAREAAVAAQGRAEREAGDVAAAEAQLRRLQRTVENRRDERDRLGREREGLVGELRAAAAEGLDERLAAAREEREFWAGREAAFGAHVGALDALIEAVEAAERSARERYTAPVLARLRPLVRAVLPDAELALARDFAPETLRRGERVEELARLSGGTREQLAILTRLGFAMLMAERGRAMPVVLDDAIVFSDDRRIERMFDALTLAGETVQVVILTCRERSFERLGGRALRCTPWQAPSER
jgi:DNA repair exonuclease SbcCD ATPase subunit